MKTFKSATQKGFTLIELLVVIAILGILAAGLIFTIDPLDKINSAQDTTAIQTITQLGRADDSYAVNNNNMYVGGNFAASVTALNKFGEIKFNSVSLSGGYNPVYSALPSGCADGACTSYVYYVNLKSKQYTGNNTGTNQSYYVYANGKGCTLKNQTAVPTTCP